MTTMELSDGEVEMVLIRRGQAATGMPHCSKNGALWYFWTWGLQPTAREAAEIGGFDILSATYRMVELRKSGRVSVVNGRAFLSYPPPPKVQPVSYRTMPR
jgi:hypothetical protein